MNGIVFWGGRVRLIRKEIIMIEMPTVKNNALNKGKKWRSSKPAVGPVNAKKKVVKKATTKHKK